jgi:hypothetical protein
VEGKRAKLDKERAERRQQRDAAPQRGKRRRRGSVPPQDAAPRRQQDDTPPDDAPDTPSGRGTRRALLVEETLMELVETANQLSGQGTEAEDLNGTLRRDARKIGRAAAAIADRWNPLAVFIDVFLGPAGPLMLARAFLPTARQLLIKAQNARAGWVEQRAQQAAQNGAALGPFGTPANFITEDGVPIFINPDTGATHLQDGTEVTLG